MGRAEKPFGEFMREVRKAEGITQCELSKRIGVSQKTICDIEKGHRNAGAETKKRFYEKMGIQESQICEISAAITPHFTAGTTLLEEIKAAYEELGHPLSEIEITAWGAAEDGELLAESALLREALDLQTKRELLAAAKASRQRWEAKAHGK